MIRDQCQTKWWAGLDREAEFNIVIASSLVLTSLSPLLSISDCEETTKMALQINFPVLTGFIKSQLYHCNIIYLHIKGYTMLL